MLPDAGERQGRGVDMNKSDLVADIAKRTKLPAAEVAQVVDTLIDTVKRSVIRGEKVVLSGFGTFHRKARAARTARDIWGERPVRVPARDVPAFNPGKPFKDAITRRRRRPPAKTPGRRARK
jgi:DNA-binding protein HU-beta